MDVARYSAPPTPIDRLEILRGGLAIFDLPRQPEVRSVAVPPLDCDVVIRMTDPIRRMESPAAPGIPDRAFRRDSVVVLPAGTESLWEIAEGQPACFHLHITSAFREIWADDVGRAACRPLSNLFDVELDALLLRIRGELAGADAFRRLAIEGLALAAAGRVLRLSGSESPARSRSAAMTPGRLRRVRDYAEEHLADAIRLDEMAAVVGLSPSHFSRAFKAETGMSPYAWVVALRVRRVKDRLLAGRGTLADIALDCGFATQSHMTATFRRATGLPPNRWLAMQDRRALAEADA